MQPLSTPQFPLECPGPVTQSRLMWLCQPEQIEHTLHLLYALNSWKQAKQQLLYADRQGLYEVQALILQQATLMGMVQAVSYIDESECFPTELLLESAAKNAAKGILIHIKDLCDPAVWPSFWPNGSNVYQHFIRPLYKRMTGKDFKRAADALDALELSQISAYIQEHLQKLVEHAQATRTPLPTRRLTALCIAPVDLLHIRDNRIYFLDGYDAWDDLDISDQRKLDPEGFSEIALEYASSQAAYTFHLPFRRAENFLSTEQIRELQRTPASSVEHRTLQGQALDQMDGLQRSAKEILQDLGVDIASVCPHHLLEKESYLSKPAIREILWPTSGRDYEDWDDDPWNGTCLPPEPA